MNYRFSQRLGAEAIGTGLIVAAVLSAALMLESLGAQPALLLFATAGVVAAVLYVVISIFQPISGAHFNPLVTVAFTLRGEKRDGWLPPGQALAYIAAQLAGAVVGAALANLMFARPALVIATVERSGSNLLLGELIATAGLLLLILLLVDLGRSQLVATAVAAWIFAGHIFTSSTSFANPAVTLGRMLSDAVSSIAPTSAVWFFVAQLLGAKLAFGLWYLLKKETAHV